MNNKNNSLLHRIMFRITAVELDLKKSVYLEHLNYIIHHNSEVSKVSKFYWLHDHKNSMFLI